VTSSISYRLIDLVWINRTQINEYEYEYEWALLECATIAFSERYDAVILTNCHNDQVEITGKMHSEIICYLQRQIKT